MTAEPVNPMIVTELRSIREILLRENRTARRRAVAAVGVLALAGVIPWVSMLGHFQGVRAELAASQASLSQVQQAEREDVGLTRMADQELALQRQRHEALLLAVRLLQTRLEERGVLPQSGGKHGR